MREKLPRIASVKALAAFVSGFKSLHALTQPEVFARVAMEEWGAAPKPTTKCRNTIIRKLPFRQQG